MLPFRVSLADVALEASLRLVNSYGAFGSVTKTRGEIVLKGTTHRDPYSGAAVWKEYGKWMPYLLRRRY